MYIFYIKQVTTFMEDSDIHELGGHVSMRDHA